MKAFIPAAGIGSRLRPMTNHKPKALVEIAGKPMLEWVILKLISAGIDQIIINLHHFPDQIRDFIREKSSFGIEIAFSDESNALLDTGGGLWKAKWFFEDGKPFIVHNVDIISSLDLGELARFQQNSASLVSLAVRDRSTSRYLHFNSNGRLTGWENTRTGEKKGIQQTPRDGKRLAFSGMQMIDPAIFGIFPGNGRFSIIDTYLYLCKEYKISSFEHNEGYWVDLGKENEIAGAEEILLKMDLKKNLKH